jgi:putative transposase
VALVFTPATLLRWQREIVKRRGTFDNRPKPGRPPVSAAYVKLLMRLARENPRWGYGKRPGELGKLGHRVSRSTITRLLRQHRLPPAPERGPSTWRAFLGHDREDMVACACFPVDTLALQRLSILFFIALGSRRVHLAGCPARPDAAWVTQQARQFSWHVQEGDPVPVRFLIHDRDGTCAAGFDTVFRSEGSAVMKTPAQAPHANAVAERVVRSIRAEGRDQLLILNQRPLMFVRRQYGA